MKTHTTSPWKQQVSLPIAVMTIAVSIVSTLAVFEQHTGLAASIRSNTIYGAMAMHPASPAPLFRRTSTTSSISSHSSQALKRREMRLQNNSSEIELTFPWGLRSHSGSVNLGTRSGSTLFQRGELQRQLHMPRF